MAGVGQGGVVGNQPSKVAWHPIMVGLVDSAEIEFGADSLVRGVSREAM